MQHHLNRYYQPPIIPPNNIRISIYRNEKENRQSFASSKRLHAEDRTSGWSARTCTHHSLCLPPCFRYRPKFARVSNNENYCSPATHNRPPKTSRCHAFPFCRIPKFSTIATQLIESNQRFFDPSVRADARCLRRGQLRGNFAHRGRIHTVFHRW